MKAEIIGFERLVTQVKVINKETKKEEIVDTHLAILTVRAELPKSLPVGEIIELSVAKPEPKDKKE